MTPPNRVIKEYIMSLKSLLSNALYSIFSQRFYRKSSFVGARELQAVYIGFVSGSHMHPKRELYKYYWWIYPANSIYPTAKDVFYKQEHQLSIKEAMDMMKELRDKKVPFGYVNTRLHRLGCAIWNYDRLMDKYPDTKFAPSYDDDTDPEWQGHK